MKRPPLNPEIGPKFQRTLYTNLWARFLYSTHNKFKAELTIQCKTRQPNTTSTQLPTLCCPNPPGKGGKFFSSSPPPNPNQWTKFSLTWCGAWSEGGMAGQGHQGQLRDRRSWYSAYHPPWLQAASVTSGQTHTRNQAHCTHQDSNTYHIQVYFLNCSMK